MKTAQNIGELLMTALIALALCAGTAQGDDPFYCYGHSDVSAIMNDHEMNGDEEYYDLTVNGTLNTNGYVLRVRGTLTNNGRITDLSSGGEGGAGGSGATGGHIGVLFGVYYEPCCCIPGASGQPPALPVAGGGAGGGGGGGGGGTEHRRPLCWLEGGVPGGDGGDGRSGGRGGGHVRICAFHLDNRGIIDADGQDGEDGESGSQGDYNDYYCQFIERDAAGGGGGGGGGGDGGDGGTVEISFVILIEEGGIHALGGGGGAGGAAGGSRCGELVHPFAALQVFHYGSPGCAPGEDGSGYGGYGGESDVGVACGPTSHGQPGFPGSDGEDGEVILGCTGIDDDVVAFALRQNVPNPFNPVTTIEYDVPVGGGRVLVEVFNIAGRRVRTLVDGVQSPGAQRVAWKGLDDGGRRVPSGVYFYRLAAPGYEDVKKMLLLE